MSSVTIRDFEVDEELGELHADGTLDTEDEYLQEIFEELTKASGVEVLNPKAREDESGYSSYLVEPGDEGFLLAVVDHLPSPYDAPSDELAGLPGYSPSDN